MASGSPGLIPTAPDFRAGGTLRVRLHLIYVDSLAGPGVNEHSDHVDEPTSGDLFIPANGLI
jgi:hypothetical protein